MGIPEEWTKHVNTLAALVALIGLDIYGLRRGTLLKPDLGTDFLSHLGGWAAGIACGVIIRMRRKPDNKKKEGNLQVEQVAKTGGMADQDPKTA